MRVNRGLIFVLILYFQANVPLHPTPPPPPPQKKPPGLLLASDTTSEGEKYISGMVVARSSSRTPLIPSFGKIY